MCRLFAISADRPVRVENPVLEGTTTFLDLSRKQHDDGWGVSYVDHSLGETSLRIIKAPYAAHEDEQFVNVIQGIISPLAIVHLREAKFGDNAFENTHPFFIDGWVFAHNGSMEKYKEIEDELGGVAFKGDTDSERYFHLILKHVEQTGSVKDGIRSAIEWLAANGFEGGKNFLMSDGRRLYAYRHGRDLFYAARDPLISETPARAVMLASEVLTDERWIEVPEDMLLIVDENQQVAMEPLVGKVASCCL